MAPFRLSWFGLGVLSRAFAASAADPTPQPSPPLPQLVSRRTNSRRRC